MVRKIAEKLDDFRLAHLRRMPALSMEQDKTPYPVQIGLFRAIAVVQTPHGFADLLQQLRFLGSVAVVHEDLLLSC